MIGTHLEQTCKKNRFITENIPELQICSVCKTGQVKIKHMNLFHTEFVEKNWFPCGGCATHFPDGDLLSLHLEVCEELNFFNEAQIILPVRILTIFFQDLIYVSDLF